MGRGLLILGALGLAIGLLGWRTSTLGQLAMNDSERAFDEGDLLGSLVAARRAASLYVPGAPHVDAALERLVAIGTGAENAGQAEIARRAWESLRGAVVESGRSSARSATLLTLAERHLTVLDTDPGSNKVSQSTKPSPGPAARSGYRVGPSWSGPLGSGLLWLSLLSVVVAAMRFLEEARGKGAGPRWQRLVTSAAVMVLSVVIGSLVLLSVRG